MYSATYNDTSPLYNCESEQSKRDPYILSLRGT